MTWPLRWSLAPLFIAGLGVLAAAACSRPFVSPLAEPPYRNRAPAGYDATWRALVRTFQAENVPLRTVAKDSGVIGSDDFVSPIGVDADCGRLGDVTIEGEALVAPRCSSSRGRSHHHIQINAKMLTQACRRGSSGELKSRRGHAARRRGGSRRTSGDRCRRR